MTALAGTAGGRGPAAGRGVPGGRPSPRASSGLGPGVRCPASPEPRRAQSVRCPEPVPALGLTAPERL